MSDSPARGSRPTGGGDPSKLGPHQAELGLETLRRVSPEDGARSPEDKQWKDQPQGPQNVSHNPTLGRKKGLCVCMGPGRKASLDI